ncbi:MAG: exodeoxyribonuclease V subunit alpha [Gemmatimonadota bacterium]
MTVLAEPLLLLHELPGLDPLDVQLAAMLVRRGGETESAVAIALATLLLSRARREGHSALSLRQLARQAGDLQAGAGHPLLATLPLREESWWTEALVTSPVLGNGQLVTPLVLRDGLLQFHRYFAAEERIGVRIRDLLAAPLVDGVPAFSIVTGGPGTGKTTRVAALLVGMVTAQPDLRVALAAPTGKAAARLTESIRLRLQATDAVGAADDTTRRALMDLEARTLHRLLSYNGETDSFRRNAGNPLPYDLVIVDEASMVDVLLLDSLLAALRAGARLMLVGDHHQLSSVEAGDVLGVLCRAAESAPASAPLHRAVTRLTRSWRFAEGEGIGAAASAILAGDVSDVWRVGHDAAHASFRIVPPAATTDALLAPVLPQLQRCLAADSVEAMLDALEAFRLLAPEREGRRGVRGLNHAVERWMARHGRAVNDTWYHGRPVLVTANDYSTRVFNGDIGVCWRTEGRLAVHFRSLDGTTRAIAPGRLPSVETAWAMTVHKSQGSEFDDVVLVLPGEESRVMSRELLYTGVTRARRSVTIVGSEASLRAAVQQRTERTSGLGQRLLP